MADTKFTPSPWRAEGRGVNLTIVFAGDALVGMDRNAVCLIADGHEPERIANAALIAAAPDLYAALEDCAEALSLARARLGMGDHGDGKDHKADADDSIGSWPALHAAHAALCRARGKS